MRCLLLAILALTMTTPIDAEKNQAEPATEKTKLLADWESMRYWMFIHLWRLCTGYSLSRKQQERQRRGMGKFTV